MKARHYNVLHYSSHSAESVLTKTIVDYRLLLLREALLKRMECKLHVARMLQNFIRPSQFSDSNIFTNENIKDLYPKIFVIWPNFSQSSVVVLVVKETKQFSV